MVRAALLFLSLALGVTLARAQTATPVNVVAGVYSTPAAYTTITGQAWGSGSYLYASGYFNPGNGGAGYSGEMDKRIHRFLLITTACPACMLTSLSSPARALRAREGDPGVSAGTGFRGWAWVPFPRCACRG